MLLMLHPSYSPDTIYLEPCNLTLSNGSHTSTIYKHGEELKIQDKTKPSIF